MLRNLHKKRWISIYIAWDALSFGYILFALKSQKKIFLLIRSVSFSKFCAEEIKLLHARGLFVQDTDYTVTIVVLTKIENWTRYYWAWLLACLIWYQLHSSITDFSQFDVNHPLSWNTLIYFLPCNTAVIHFSLIISSPSGLRSLSAW